VRRVLILAYHFPPVGGAGVQRTLKFVKHLPGLGWEPVVVTGPLDSVGDANLKDDTLAGQLPEGLDVRRVPGPEPEPQQRWRGRAERLLRVPNPWSRWWVDGAAATGAEVQGVDVVFATMAPFQTCAPAERLSRQHAVPWVADLRDPWALDEMYVYPSGLHRRLDVRRMGRSLSSAARIVMNTEEAGLALGRAFPELRARAVVIPNGFEAADFDGSRPDVSRRSFRIVHTGELHTEFGLRHRERGRVRRLLGGALEGVDILTRSHVFLLEAVERLRARRPELRGLLEVHLVGALDDVDRAAITSEAVHEHGYVGHAEAVALMRSADLLFFPMQDVAPPGRARIVPGKLYEYLATGRPILAAVPDGDARDLLMRAGGVSVCRPADVDCLEAAVEEAVDRKLVGAPEPRREMSVIAHFERSRLSARLAGALAAAADDRPPTPRSSPPGR
jgi:glycosyltransferase involved in cell wall biosynthesis